MTYTLPEAARAGLNKWFTIFWSLHPDAIDWANWRAAGKPRIMCTLDMLRGGQGSGGERFRVELRTERVELYVRVDEHDIYHTSPATIRAELLALTIGVTVIGVFLGNEWENGINWEYGSPSWGQNYTYYVANCLLPIIRYLKGRDRANAVIKDAAGAPIGRVPFLILAGGWTGSRSISEDEPAFPGFITARDIIRDALWETEGIGGHVYEYGWTDPVDPIRAKFWLKFLRTVFHMGNIYVDEFGADNGGPYERARHAVRAAAMLRVHPEYSRSVPMFCPFVANGDPYVRDASGQVLKNPDGSPRVHWDPNYLMREPRIYTELFGPFVTSGIVPD